jgi:hypothetical protein
MFTRSGNGLKRVGHVRNAPSDGLLHLSGAKVYTYIIQLLIRRTLFDRICYFEARGERSGISTGACARL